MSRLQNYNPNVRVSGANAKQDKIRMGIGNWYVQGISNSLGCFISLLAPRPADPTEENASIWLNMITTLSANVIGDEYFGWIFNRPAGDYSTQTGMTVRGGGSGSGPQPGSPLFRGSMRIKGVRPLNPDFEETERRRLSLELFLNPTRFVRHQTIPGNILDLTRLRFREPPNMRTVAIPRRRTTRAESEDSEIETSLDGKDNVLIGAERLSFARPAFWPRHLRRYFEGMASSLQTEFERAAEMSGLRIGGGNAGLSAVRYSLKEVETYFEFAHSNPSRLVRSLEPALESLAQDFCCRSFPIGRFEMSRESNARSVLLQLGQGRKLRVYAKTTHRIRFEIVHDVTNSNIAALLNPGQRRHTTSFLPELLSWFPRLAHDAANELNRVFDSIQNMLERPHDAADVYEFLGAVFAIGGNARRNQDLLTLLVENGCVCVGRRGSDFLPEIQKLRRRGVITRNGNTDTVAPRFRAALDHLREQSNLPPLSSMFLRSL